MKTSTTLAACAVLLTTPLAFSQGRNVGPIGVGAPDKTDIALAKAMGLKLGKAYSVNRDILLRTSWKPDTDGVSRSPLFRVALEEGIIDHPLFLRISKLKGRRNSVHLTQKVSNNVVYYVGLSRSAYDTVYQAIAQTKAWKAAHP